MVFIRIIFFYLFINNKVNFSIVAKTIIEKKNNIQFTNIYDSRKYRELID